MQLPAGCKRHAVLSGLYHSDSLVFISHGVGVPMHDASAQARNATTCTAITETAELAPAVLRHSAQQRTAVPIMQLCFQQQRPEHHWPTPQQRSGSATCDMSAAVPVCGGLLVFSQIHMHFWGCRLRLKPEHIITPIGSTCSGPTNQHWCRAVVGRRAHDIVEQILSN